MNLQANLVKYAQLILKVGLNIQPGDKLLVRLDEHGLPLAREIARQAYDLSAHDIQLMFQDDGLTLARYLHAPDAAFDRVPGFFADFREAAYLDNYHLLALNAPNPELLKQADPARISRWEKVQSQANERIMKYTMENQVKWSIAALPSPAWAVSVFPQLEEAAAISALWEKIFEATRVNLEDPVAAWEAHQQALARHVDFLNRHHFEKLHYEGPGTDLVVYLPQGHVWKGGASRIPRGDSFMPNLPTEEVFTLPHAHKVDGTLAATLPLSTRGRLIEGLRFTFRDGQVVDFAADSGADIIKGLLDTDEGARRLGEVALVGEDSPIRRTGLLFRNTLFDENASCHFALGQAYAENLEGGSQMDREQQKAAGMNRSLIHVDFMVGGPQLRVTGYTPQGQAVPLLVAGNWVV
ncbi:MAG: aminopeptidase [Clostridiales bacterium]|nr:aminopeptidase [Clostridiales bacterium]